MISFKLYNILNIFQVFINDILKNYFDILYFIYLDNILVYNNTK